MADFTWVILEDSFPQSINNANDPLDLRKGECSDIVNIGFVKDGVLARGTKPSPSGNFVAKAFVAPGSGATSSTIENVWRFGRRWRASLSEPKLEYTGIQVSSDDSFTLSGSLEFAEEGDDLISMVIPLEDKWVVLKPKAAYVVERVAGDAAEFKKRTAYEGFGCSNPGTFFSNATISRSVVAAWDLAGDTGPRHFLWDTRNAPTELGRNVREIAEKQTKQTRCEINWGEQLVIAGDLVYDLEAKRIYHFTGQDSVTYLSRPYHQAHFRPITVRGLEFICQGKEGSFDVEILYSRDKDGEERSEEQKIRVTSATKKRYRHTWQIQQPITCRVYRLRIKNLKGTGIHQIAAFVKIADSKHAWEDAD